MAEVASAFVSLVPSAKGFGKATEKQITPQLGSAGKKGGSVFGSAFKGALSGILAGFGAKAVVGFFAGAIEGASDLAESASKVNVVFGEQADVIVKTSKTSATAMGISKGAYLDAAGSLGNLLVSLNLAPKAAAGMSTQMVQLASDMASFNNTSPKEALDAIRSGLTGETEPLKRFGVNMNEATLKAQALKLGLIKTTKQALTPQQKALAAHALIMAQTGTAQGDFARTSGGLANQQRILSAQFANFRTSIGTALLPVITRLVTILNTQAMPVLRTMIAFLKANPQVLIAFGVALGVLAAAFIAVQIAAFAIPLAIAALAAAVVYAYLKFETFRNIVNATFAFLKAVVTTVLPYVAAIIRAQLTIIIGIVKLFAALFKGDWKGVWEAVKQILRGALALITAILRAQLAIVVAVVRAVGSLLLAAAKSAFGKLKDGAVSGVKALLVFVGSIPGRISSALGNLGSLLFNAGRALISGLISGILSKLGDLAGAMGSVASKVKGFLPGSPVKEGPLKSWNNGGAGKRLIDMGLIDGIISRKPALAAAMTDLTTLSALNSSVSVPAGARLSGVNVAQAAGANGLTERAIENATRRGMDGATLNVPGLGKTRLSMAGA